MHFFRKYLHPDDEKMHKTAITVTANVLPTILIISKISNHPLITGD
jgi:hypothetical protein